MTKDEIIEELKAGSKVTHRFFTENEWVELREGNICDERGYPCAVETFWQYRNGEEWDTGWEIYF